MRKFKMLILTDHTKHSNYNSLYKLALALRRHPRCAQVDIASRGFSINDNFFKYKLSKAIYVSKVNEDFAFHEEAKSLKKQLHRKLIAEYDVILLRLPPPFLLDFAHFLEHNFPYLLCINRPLSIIESGDKRFLLNFSSLCPAMELCKSVEAIDALKQKHPIVLKPLQSYGGNGIIRIDGEQVWEGKQETTWSQLVMKFEQQPIEYLAVEYLQNVWQGDKRIIVVNGQIVGATLRVPPKDSWLCNSSMGGSSYLAQPDEDEIRIIKQVQPKLSEMGIVMFGIDTLMGNNGKRLLSEINTTSIGGIAPLSELTDRPIMKQTAALLWDFITENRI